MAFAFGRPETGKTQGATHFVRKSTPLLGRTTASNKALLGLTPADRLTLRDSTRFSVPIRQVTG